MTGGTLPAADGAAPVDTVSREDFDRMSADLTRAKNLLVRLYDEHPAARAQIEGSTGAWFVWGKDRDAPAQVSAAADERVSTTGFGSQNWVAAADGETYPVSKAPASERATQDVVTGELPDIIHDLRQLHAAATPGQWRQGMTSHHTVSVNEDREPYRVAEFRHAADASFCDAAHRFLPMLLDALASPQVAPAPSPNLRQAMEFAFTVLGLARLAISHPASDSTAIKEQIARSRKELFEAVNAASAAPAPVAPTPAASPDGIRYRRLRAQNWHDSDLFVVAGGKASVRLGVDCPFGDRLDAMVDALPPLPEEGQG